MNRQWLRDASSRTTESSDQTDSTGSSARAVFTCRADRLLAQLLPVQRPDEYRRKEIRLLSQS